tara:strand:+ start:50 stop:1000 length:951 start_codon:yes stop_codon:yes gene_type:complete
MTFNLIYINYKYPFYLNNDINKNFIFSNKNHENYNFHEYICIQELIHFSKKNVNYYHFYIYNSIFDNELTKTRAKIYRDIQKFNLLFSKFVLIIKNRYKKTKNNRNLLLDNFKKKYIKIIQYDSLYNFDYFELYKIVKESFFFNIEKFHNTIIIKNPYTNMKMNDSILIIIYFELLKYGNVPEMFFLYFKSNFCNKKFKENYFINLYINNFKNNFYNFSNKAVLKYITNMLNCDVKFIMFNNLDDSTKLTLFKKIVLYYFLQVKIESHFCLDYETITTNYYNSYYNYLNNLKKKNPLLGRIVYKDNKSSVINDYIN